MGLMLSTENITPSEENLCEVVYNIVAQIPRQPQPPGRTHHAWRSRWAAALPPCGVGNRETCPALPSPSRIARCRRRKVVPLGQSLLEDIPLVSIKSCRESPRRRLPLLVITFAVNRKDSFFFSTRGDTNGYSLVTGT